MGSHGYHELIGVDANEARSLICPASPLPRRLSDVGSQQADDCHEFAERWISDWFAIAGAPVPAGTFFIPAGAARANPAIANTWTWFSLGTSTYHALQVDLRRRFSSGFSVRGVYTFSKALDDGDSVEPDHGRKRAGAGFESFQSGRG